MNDWMIDIWQLRKEYPTPSGPALIVRDFTLKVREGEFVCIIGHSGCGKSTVLSIVMGLNTPTSGTVIVGGKEVTGPGRDRGVVFQSAALLPWLTVRDNILLAVEARANARSLKERRQLADQYLEQVGLRDVGDCRPDELSAGMRQRVGIARAFAVEPQVLLLDEPFSLLDALTRLELQEELLRICDQTRKTVLMVTHDVDEALLLADRVVMMTTGPAATIGGILPVPLPRLRTRATSLENPGYYPARDHLLRFLEHGIPPPAEEKGNNDAEEKGDDEEEVNRATTVHPHERLRNAG